MGSLRSSAQMISYEVIMSFIFMPAIILQETLNIFDFALLQKNFFLFYYLIPINIFFLIASLAETNRAPFDLPEAEAELVAGYNVEYSSMLFALFFLAEYSNMGAISGVFINIYGGGFYLTPFMDSMFFLKKYFSLTGDILNYSLINNFMFFELFFSTLFFSIKVVLLCSIFI
jgi:NADH-quinone oxidoreductase subunit H